MIAYVCSFTEVGFSLEKRLRAGLPEVFWVSRDSAASEVAASESAASVCAAVCACADPSSAATEPIKLVTEPTLSARDFAEKAFKKHLPLVFIGATGIAVRISADFIKDKFFDSPVVVIDERGEFVIPLVSGHIGGANDLARMIAGRLGAVPVITTASDVENKFAVDVFARRNGFSIVNREAVKHVTGKLLRGENACVWVHPSVACPSDGIPPELLVSQAATPPENADIIVLPDESVTCDWGDGAADATGVSSVACVPGATDAEKRQSCAAGNLQSFDRCVILVPKLYCVGMGCKKGKPFEELFAFLESSVSADIRRGIYAIASIDLKKDEIGLMELAQYLHVPFVIYTAAELAAVPGDFSESDFVREQTGVSNVCERAAVLCATDDVNANRVSGVCLDANRAAVLCAGEGGVLVCKKIAKDGMTVAVAKRKPRITTWET